MARSISSLSVAIFIIFAVAAFTEASRCGKCKPTEKGFVYQVDEEIETVESLIEEAWAKHSSKQTVSVKEIGEAFLNNDIADDTQYIVSDVILKADDCIEIGCVNFFIGFDGSPTIKSTSQIRKIKSKYCKPPSESEVCKKMCKREKGFKKLRKEKRDMAYAFVKDAWLRSNKEKVTVQKIGTAYYYYGGPDNEKYKISNVRLKTDSTSISVGCLTGTNGKMGPVIDESCRVKYKPLHN